MIEIEEKFWNLVEEDYKMKNDGTHPDSLKKHRQQINKLFHELAFQPGQNKSHYWKHCSGQTFKTHYTSRVQEYLFNHIDHSEIDFLKHEYLTVSKFAHQHKDPTLLSFEIQQLDHKFYYQKREFLISKLSTFNLKPFEVDEIDSDETGNKEVLTYVKWQNIILPKVEIKDEKTFTPTVYQKVIILDKMGVFEKLPMNNQGNLNQSVSAAILSLLTGHDKSNFRKHLSALEEKPSKRTEKQKADELEILKKLQELGWYLG